MRIIEENFGKGWPLLTMQKESEEGLNAENFKEKVINKNGKIKLNFVLLNSLLSGCSFYITLTQFLMYLF